MRWALAGLDWLLISIQIIPCSRSMKPRVLALVSSTRILGREWYAVDVGDTWPLMVGRLSLGIDNLPISA
jgi:hypothetical protein